MKDRCIHSAMFFVQATIISIVLPITLIYMLASCTPLLQYIGCGFILIILFTLAFFSENKELKNEDWRFINTEYLCNWLKIIQNTQDWPKEMPISIRNIVYDGGLIEQVEYGYHQIYFRLTSKGTNFLNLNSNKS